MGRRISPSGFRSSGAVMVVFICCCIILCSSFSSGAGIKSEFLHREHHRSPLRSTKNLTQFEKTKLDAERSLARARSLTATVDDDSPNERFDASLSNAAPYEYLMTVSLGTPPQTFSVIADTGSDLNWLQCDPCIECYDQKDAPFDPSSSSTFQSFTCSDVACLDFIQSSGLATVTGCSVPTDTTSGCDYIYRYGGKTNTSGTFSSETINLVGMDGESVPVPNFWFGCSSQTIPGDASYASGLADGLFGFGQNSISFSSQIGLVVENQFSYCLVTSSSATTLSSRLVIGDDTGLPEMNLALSYTPFTGPGFYYVTVDQITVAGVDVVFNKSVLQVDANNEGGFIFDSGTTFIILDSQVFDPLTMAIAEQISSDFVLVDVTGFDVCYNDEAGLASTSFPTIGFVFGGVSVSWDLPFENAWATFQTDVGTPVACLMVLRSTFGPSIFGNRAQQNYYVLHDRVNNQIGFAPADCGTVSPDIVG